MSFYNAAIFDDNNDESFLNNKRKHSKTQKNYKENFDKGKVNSVLEAVHKNQKPDDDEDEAGNFNPPPPTQSVGSEKARVTKENMMNMTNQNDIMFRTLGSAPQPNNQENNDLDLNNYSNYGDKKTVEEYYKKMLPGYNPNNQNVQNTNSSNRLYHRMNNDQASNVAPTQDVLLQKINYMISLLEDQQDEKTNNVTEEVVLYSFLGIFIIFIVDSFAKVGKYVR
jgi:hypothetical protein